MVISHSLRSLHLFRFFYPSPQPRQPDRKRDAVYIPAVFPSIQSSTLRESTVYIILEIQSLATSKSDGQPRRCLDVSRAKEDFGFEAKVNFREGLEKAIEWYRTVLLSGVRK